MSLSQLVKNEICGRAYEGCCLEALLSAVIHTCGSLSFTSGGMSVIIPANTGTTEFLTGAFLALYEKKTECISGKVIVSGGDVTDILVSLGILKMRDGLKLDEGINPALIETECCKKAYLAGAFLGCGSAAALKNGYNIEFNLASQKVAEGLAKLLAYFEIRAGLSEKPPKAKLYIKNKEHISDCLALMGASRAVLELNSLIAERDLKLQSVRQANCDLANLDKMVAASIVQQEAIRGLKDIPSGRLQDVAKARLKYPESSYEELALILGISKSAVKYRLNKLVEMYREMH